MNTMVQNIHSLLQEQVNQARQDNPLFFKTGPGEYAEHDKFLGVSVPTVRTIAKKCTTLSLEDIQVLLMSPYNEERLLALFILVGRYQKADKMQKDALYHYYLAHLKQVNNWNLVDSSAHAIIGAHLFVYDLDRNMLIQYAQSPHLWERRVAIIATWYFIKQSDFVWTIKIAQLLLRDTHDLIHKAVGWMLREMGKKDEARLKVFLDEHAACMPRTMLRYAIEKLSSDERQKYLRKV